MNNVGQETLIIVFFQLQIVAQELSHWCHTGACLSLEILIIKIRV